MQTKKLANLLKNKINTMKNIFGIVTIIILLNGCSLPLIGSLSTSTVTGAATGNYQKSALSSGLDLAVHGATGKTPSQHLLEWHKERR